MNILFLGTSCMVPTKERNASAIYIDYGGEGILMDCGEGTQRQLNIAGIPRNRVKKILISHFHGDHMAGLIGLLQTMGNEVQNQKVMLFGPKGTKIFMNHILQCCHFDLQLDLVVEEVTPKGVETFYENEFYILQASELDHGVPCIGFSFIEKDKIKIDMAKAKKYGLTEGPLIGKLQQGKDVEFKGKVIQVKDVSHKIRGKKVTYISDTMFTEHCILLAEQSDLLISEASYTSKLEEKAKEYKHMTAQQAAYVANTAQVKRLILTHLSQRYKTGTEVLEDAQHLFDNVEVAYDFMKIKL